MSIPKWVETQAAAIGEACAGDRFSDLEWRASAPNENEWECWLVEIAPEQLELGEQGPNDGAEIFDPIQIDLLALREAFSEVESFDYHPGSRDREPRITLCGKAGKRDLVAEIFFQPFEDAVTRTVVEPHSGSIRFRPKGSSE